MDIQYNISAAGPIFEPADMPGLASLTATMLREGTKTRSSEQIAEQTAQLGATVTASSGFGSSATVINASGLSDNFEQWFGIANDILLSPTFPNVELNRLKARLKVQLTQQRASPAFLERERFNKAVYGAHPASVITPTAAAVDAITSDILRKWHDDHYTPQNAVLGITGDIKDGRVATETREVAC